MYMLARLVSLSALACCILNINAHSESRNPLSYLSLVENVVIHTPSHKVESFSSFDLTFDSHRPQQKIKLSLEPNHDILPDGATVEYLDVEGEVRRTELIERSSIKVFKGYAWILDESGSWGNVGWARIVVRRDGTSPLFEGAFTVMHNHHHVQLRSNYMQTKHEMDPAIEHSDDEYMVMWRDSDIRPEVHQELKRSEDDSGSLCHSDKLLFNIQPEHPVYSTVLKRDTGFWGSMSVGSLLGKRQIDSGTWGNSGNGAGVNLKSTIGDTSGCPTTRKVALVGVATDCTYTAAFNSTESARQNVITQINSASDLYEKSFNITLGLHTLVVSDANCPGTPPSTAPWNSPCSSNVTIQDRLNTFSAWRGTRSNDTNAYWTLLTTCNTGSAVGLAWLGQVCVTDAQTNSGETVSGANVVARTATEWQVIAHETGHTFGAVHDCTSSTCNDGTTVNSQQCCPLSQSVCDASARFIMNPSTGNGISAFSPCSIGNICSAMGRNSVKTSCLSANKGVTTISGNQCGNGIVEDGEDCDCGGDASCAGNQCCDAKTCKFKNNAVCDDSNEDCCKGCQFAPSTMVCRASTGVCDPQETCTGTTAVCPVDQTAPDGQKCGNNSALACASGQCTSRDQQCKTLMGSYTQKNDTYACDSSSCTLSCASPEFGANVCYSMRQNFLDGTACGGGGKCQNGVCKGSSVIKEVGGWISQNKPLVIGLAAGIGGFLLLSIVGCVCSCFKRRKNRKRTPTWPQQRGYAPAPPQPVRRSLVPGWAGSQRQQQQQPYWQPPPPVFQQPTVRYA